MTSHSQRNLVKFIEDQAIQESDAAKLLAKCRKALSLSRYRESCAVIVRLQSKVSASYAHRDFWGENDTLVAIIRDGKVITVMLTRSSQCRKDHFRTDEIFS